jgi:phosphoglycerate dehydrogenase-like enzyme
VRDPEGVWNLPAHLGAALAAAHPQVRFLSPRDPAEVDRVLPEADVVFGWAVRTDNFHAARRLRWIHTSAAGVGSLLFPALVESDVVLTNGRGLHAQSMAEHAVGVLLAFARRLHVARDAQREGRWTQVELWTRSPSFGQIAGSTLGLVGFGAVGQAVARAARALGMSVIVVRRHPAESPDVTQWGPERLGEMLERVDAVVLAAPLTDASRGMIGRHELARLRPHAVLVNLGRGGLVDEAALVEALRTGRLAGAALDVFEREPLPATSPLWGMPQAIVTPHVSGLGPRYWERSVELFDRNLSAFLARRPLENVVDKRAGY